MRITKPSDLGVCQINTSKSNPVALQDQSRASPSVVQFDQLPQHTREQIMSYMPSSGNSARKTLLSLCLTSKALKKAAEPALQALKLKEEAKKIAQGNKPNRKGYASLFQPLINKATNLQSKHRAAVLAEIACQYFENSDNADQVSVGNMVDALIRASSGLPNEHKVTVLAEIAQTGWLESREARDAVVTRVMQAGVGLPHALKRPLLEYCAACTIALQDEQQELNKFNLIKAIPGMSPKDINLLKALIVESRNGWALMDRLFSLPDMPEIERVAEFDKTMAEASSKLSSSSIAWSVYSSLADTIEILPKEKRAERLGALAEKAASLSTPKDRTKLLCDVINQIKNLPPAERLGTSAENPGIFYKVKKAAISHLPKRDQAIVFVELCKQLKEEGFKELAPEAMADAFFELSQT